MSYLLTFLKNKGKKKTIKLRVIGASILVLILAAMGRTYPQDPLMNISLDKKEIGVGENVKITLQMRWEQPENSDLKIIQITAPASPLLELIDSKQTTSSRLTAGGIFAQRIIEYFYLGKEKGQAQIQPAVVEYVYSNDPESKRMVKSETLAITIISSWKNLGGEILAGGIWGLIIILITGVILWVIACFKKKGKPKVTIKDSHLEKEFLAKLQDYEQYRVFGEIKEFYSRIKELFIWYIQTKYKITFSGNYPDENGREKLPEDLKILYFEWNKAAETVCFSGYQPAKNEQEKLVRQTKRYLKSLIAVEKPEELIETVD